MNKYKLPYLIGTLLLAIALVYGYNQHVKENQNEGITEAESIETWGQKTFNENPSELVNGLERVLNTLDQLSNTLAGSDTDVKNINQVGKTLEENWDIVEKKVEALNKSAYTDIEKSLYPLIAEAKKKDPNIDQMKQLLQESTDKITKFKNDVKGSS